jgi:hypothetical protein
LERPAGVAIRVVHDDIRTTAGRQAIKVFDPDLGGAKRIIEARGQNREGEKSLTNRATRQLVRIQADEIHGENSSRTVLGEFQNPCLNCLKSCSKGKPDRLGRKTLR